MAENKESPREVPWHEKLDPEKYIYLEKQYVNKTNCEEIFSIFWGIEEVHKALAVNYSPPTKCEKLADKLRSDGNDAYKRKELGDALRLYNLSIMEAPHPVLPGVPAPEEVSDSQDTLGRWIDPAKYGGVAQGESRALAMGYGNRSAVMFELQAYDECLNDIDLAYEYGYPQEVRNKLEIRKEKCLAAKNDKMREEADQKQVSDVTSANKGASGCEKGFSMEEAISITAANFAKLQFPATKTSPQLTFPLPMKNVIMSPLFNPPEMAEESESVPCLSRSVQVTYQPGRGRCLTATRNIVTGETIGVEKAYAVYINTEDLARHCSYCLRRTLKPLPCPACNKVIFCSNKCRTNGLAEEHWIECSVLPTMEEMELFSKHLIVKMMKNSTANQFQAVLQRVKEVNHEEPEKVGCNEHGKYLPGSYHTVHHLCSNMEKQRFHMLFALCQIAYVITKMLEFGGRFFVDDEGRSCVPTREDLIKTGGGVLSHAVILNYNPYELIDLQTKRQIGAGVHPALSLINHSCTPNVKHYNCDRYIVLRAVRPIKAGEEITDSYTKPFSEEDLESRISFLENYFITCTCEACQNKWPLYNKLSALSLRCYLCKQVAVGQTALCLDCQKKSPSKISQREILQQVEKANTLWAALYEVIRAGMQMKETNCMSDEDYKLLCETIDMVRERVFQPSQTLCDLQNILMRAFELGH